MKNIFLIALLFLAFVAKSQDLLKTIYGDEINVKITEITKEEVKYTKVDDLNNASYTMRIVKIEKIAFEDGTEKVFDGTLDLVEKEDEVLFKKKEKNDKIDNEELSIKAEMNTNILPENLRFKAQKGANVFLQSRDNNAAIHAKNYINDWGYWTVTPDIKNADFILKLIVRFQGPMHFFITAQFIDSGSNEVLFTTEEFKAAKGNKDPNHKRAAVKQIVDLVLKSNFK
jgi:hypothetical protein